MMWKLTTEHSCQILYNLFIYLQNTPLTELQLQTYTRLQKLYSEQQADCSFTQSTSDVSLKDTDVSFQDVSLMEGHLLNSEQDISSVSSTEKGDLHVIQNQPQNFDKLTLEQGPHVYRPDSPAITVSINKLRH